MIILLSSEPLCVICGNFSSHCPEVSQQSCLSDQGQVSFHGSGWVSVCICQMVSRVLMVPSAVTLESPGLLGFQWERAEP